MAYVLGGEMMESRPWRLSFIPEFFWGIINFVVLFFKTMINPNTTSKGNNQSTDYRLHGRGPGDGPGGPRRRMGGFRGGPGGPSAPPMGGGG